MARGCVCVNSSHIAAAAVVCFALLTAVAAAEELADFQESMATVSGLACRPTISKLIGEAEWICLHDNVWNSKWFDIVQVPWQSTKEVAGLEDVCTSPCANIVFKVVQQLDSAGCPIVPAHADLGNEGYLLNLMSTVGRRLKFWCTHSNVERKEEQYGVGFSKEDHPFCFEVDRDTLLIALSTTTASFSNITASCITLNTHIGCFWAYTEMHAIDTFLQSIFSRDFTSSVFIDTCASHGVKIKTDTTVSPYLLGINPFISLSEMKSMLKTTVLATCWQSIDVIFNDLFFQSLRDEEFVENVWFSPVALDDQAELTPLAEACLLSEANVVASAILTLESRGCDVNTPLMSSAGLVGQFLANFWEQLNYNRLSCTRSTNGLCNEMESSFVSVASGASTTTSCIDLLAYGGCVGSFFSFLELQPSQAEAMWDLVDIDNIDTFMRSECDFLGINILSTYLPETPPIFLGYYDEDEDTNANTTIGDTGRNYTAPGALEDVRGLFYSATDYPDECQATVETYINGEYIACMGTEALQTSAWVEDIYSALPLYYFTDSGLEESCADDCTNLVFYSNKQLQEEGCVPLQTQLADNQDVYWKYLFGFLEVQDNREVQCTVSETGNGELCGVLFQDLLSFFNQGSTGTLATCNSIIEHGHCLGNINSYLMGEATRPRVHFGQSSAVNVTTELRRACRDVGFDVTAALSATEAPPSYEESTSSSATWLRSSFSPLFSIAGFLFTLLVVDVLFSS
eukprot:m.61422 g.61422  ORF g.61422 m.61422 type:complete len:743 (-) comp11388_c0_seq1:112-2340(-)